MKTHGWLVVASMMVASQVTVAQSLASRVAAARGTVGFEFTTRANVCGNGQNITISDGTPRGGIRIGRFSSDERSHCQEGPGRVVLEHSGARVTELRVTVGGRTERADTELGAVKAPEAARYLLSIAPSLAGKAGDKAVMGAAIADSVVLWQRMLEIARDNDASDASRKASLFWVSQEVGAVATAGLRDVAMDDDAEAAVRKDALFYLAQRPKGEGIPGLIRVVKESKSARLRKDAIWHLSQSRDVRAIELFEQLLAGK